MIEFACHQCKTRLKVKDSAAGQTVACPRCQTALTIPGDKPAPIAPVKSTLRHPLGDPPPGESSDPAQRVVELSAQNRELQEKLRRKETELELARLKIADLAKTGAGEPKPVSETASPVPPPSVPPTVEPPTAIVNVPQPGQPSKGWGIRILLVLLVAIISLLIWYSGRRSRPVPVALPAQPNISVPVEQKIPPAPVVVPAPSPMPPPAVTPAPIQVVPETVPSPAKVPEPPKTEALVKPPEAVLVAPTNGPAGLASPVPPEPIKPSGVSP